MLFRAKCIHLGWCRIILDALLQSMLGVQRFMVDRDLHRFWQARWVQRAVLAIGVQVFGTCHSRWNLGRLWGLGSTRWKQIFLLLRAFRLWHRSIGRSDWCHLPHFLRWAWREKCRNQNSLSIYGLQVFQIKMKTVDKAFQKWQSVTFIVLFFTNPDLVKLHCELSSL